MLMTYYTEGFVEFGFVTLFAAIFPLGPFIATLSNILEIRSKLFVFLRVFKRPESKNCDGIGDWVSVWEIYNIIGIISNLALLYEYHNDGYLLIKTE
jgi:hypothetical protein